MGARADVLWECGQTNSCVHQHNGVGWYHSDDYSWGFAPGGEEVDRQSCDWDGNGPQTFPELRMCWHTDNGNITTGYRCGDNDLNSNSGWERLIYHVP